MGSWGSTGGDGGPSVREPEWGGARMCSKSPCAPHTHTAQLQARQWSYVALICLGGQVHVLIRKAGPRLLGVLGGRRLQTAVRLPSGSSVSIWCVFLLIELSDGAQLAHGLGWQST